MYNKRKELIDLIQEQTEWKNRLIQAIKNNNYTPKEKEVIVELSKNRLREINNDINAIKYEPKD